jgi:hypothetical protein
LIPLPLLATVADGTPPDVRQISAHIVKHSKVLVLPFPAADFTEPMRWQSATGFRYAMPGGYFIGPAWDGRGYIGGDVPRQTTQVLEKIEDGSHAPALSTAELAGANTDLLYWHVTEVMLGPGPGHDALAATLTAALGAPTLTIGSSSLWLCNGGTGKFCQVS